MTSFIYQLVHGQNYGQKRTSELNHQDFFVALNEYLSEVEKE
jgi:hypothetical protein